MQYGPADVLRLIGALGLFLFGMKVMSDALLELAGNRMRTILATMTSNRFLGVLTGFLITAIIQSSSATTLMVVSFSNASLLTLTESLGVIMGANIGTTITAWLITILGFKVSMSSIALPLVGLGFALTFSKKTAMKNRGNFIIGFALLFIGLQFLKEAMPHINENPGMLEFLTRYTRMGFGSVLLFLLIGTVLTVVIQSSSATMAMTLLMTSYGWIPYDLAAAMVLGENIGTTVTANIAALVGNYQAKRTARAHLIFNLIGVAWMLLLFYPFLRLVDGMVTATGTPSAYAELTAIPVAVSLFHTAFNLSNTLVLVWFIVPISRLVTKMVAKTGPERSGAQPVFLDAGALAYPETALAALNKETEDLFKNAVFEIVAHSLNIHRKDIRSTIKLKKVISKSQLDFKTDVRDQYNQRVKTIYGEIIRYATLAQSALQLNEEQNNRISEIKMAARMMVEILRDANELSRNISSYLGSDNEYIRKEYNRLRRKAAKVLRAVYRFSSNDYNEQKQHYYERLLELKEMASRGIYQTSMRIDGLIREDQITTLMASSLVNDRDNVNDMIRKLITVAGLLYSSDDPNFETRIPPAVNTGEE